MVTDKDFCVWQLYVKIRYQTCVLHISKDVRHMVAQVFVLEGK